MPADTVADVTALALRAASFIAVLQAAGVPLFVSLMTGDLLRSRQRIERTGLGLAVVAIVLAITQQAVEPARLSGSLAGVLDPSLQTMLLTSAAGTATATRVAGLALVLARWLVPGRAATVAGILGTVLVVVSFTLMGHTTSHSPRWPLAALLVLHVAVIAFWFGALQPLRIAIAAEQPERAGQIVARFSRVALWLVPFIGIAGVLLAALLLPGLDSLGTPFGLAIVAKGVGFAVLMGLAAVNKWSLGPRLSGDAPAVASALRRSITAEWLVIVLVLAVTAVLTGLFAPEH